MDIVIGCITGYDFDKIKPWVNSLDRSGFQGTKAMMCYNVSFDTVEELVKRDYSVLTFNKNENLKRFEYKENFSIVVERFFHLWYFLRQLKGEYRYIVTTDVKDVVFQSNPIEWLEKNIGDKQINVGCESITYENEEWGKNNLQKAYGTVLYEHNKNNLIYNAGTISGKFDTMIDFFLNIYMLCQGTNHYIEGGGGPDQAALNILLNMKPYKDITNFAMSEDGYAAQLGTTGPQVRNTVKHRLIENCPVMINDTVCTSTEKPFAIVHQYDRITEWKEIIERKYG